MFRILLLLLIIIPAAEIGILIWSGTNFGIPVTILLIIATGIVGAWLARREGMETLKLAQIQLRNAQVPSDVLLDGVCILVGGTLLLTPGFITDTVGFLLLIPYTRSIFKIGMRRFIQKKIDSGQFTFTIRR